MWQSGGIDPHLPVKDNAALRRLRAQNATSVIFGAFPVWLAI
jgi:hypothetical protein